VAELKLGVLLAQHDRRTLHPWAGLEADQQIDGRQPGDLTAEKLLEHSRLPLVWHDQRTTLSFG
jgi:hypothetical protein